jgi:hypothetical protein
MQLKLSKFQYFRIFASVLIMLGAANAAFAAEEVDSDYIDTTGIDKEVDYGADLFNKFFKHDSKDQTEEVSDDVEIRIQEQEKPGISENIAVLRVIDKTLGKLYLLDLEVGSKRTINEITIKATSCIRPSEKLIVPEGRAFIEVFETRKRVVEKLFGGWIYAQSPAVSQLSHPKYDITLASCKVAQAPVPKAQTTADPAPVSDKTN